MSPALIELHSRLADLAYETAEALAVLVRGAVDDGMDAQSLERVVDLLCTTVATALHARDVAALTKDAAEDREAAARARYLSLLP